MISDHCSIFAVRKKVREDKRVKMEYVRDYSKFDKNVFCQALDNLDWNRFDIEMNPETQWEIIYYHVMGILLIMCPLKAVHTRLYRKKWITKEIYSLIRNRKLLVRRYYRERSPSILEEIRKARNIINAKIERAKSEYIRNLLGSTKKEPKKFWRNIKNLIDGENADTQHVIFKNPLTGVDVPDSEVPNFLNEYFANISDRVCDPMLSKVYIPGDIRRTSMFFNPPEQYEIMIYAEEIDINSSSCINGMNSMICKCLILHKPDKFRLLFANSMFTGYFPFSWTLSRVKLIPKSGDLSDPNNWRPISMTNIFSKLLEKLVHSQVLKYFLDNQLIDKNQFGFLPGKSTHEAIFKVVHYIYNALNNRKLTGMLLLDIAKAFNCISHEILYTKMFAAGFDKTVIQWFRTYLHRTQQVGIYNMLSDIIPVTHGIAQGTVSGPILFIFYINDIFKCTKYVKMSLYADDCIMFLSGNDWNVIHRRMQRDFDSVIDWTFCNNLRLNQEKTHSIIFGSKLRISNIQDQVQFCTSGKKVKFVKNQSYLGITLDSTMSLMALVKSVKKK